MSVIRVNNITNRSGSAGPTIAGVGIVSSTSYMVVPTGRTGQRYADEGENIVRDGLVLYLDAKHSYPSKTGIGTTTSGASATAGSSLDGEPYTWYDMSGYENHGELIGGVGYNISNGGSLVFDGVNDYISLGPTIQPTNITVSSWFNANNVSGSFSLVRWRFYGFELKINTSGIVNGNIWINDAVNPTVDTSNNYISAGQIYNAVMTCGDGQIKLYVNNVLIGSKNLSDDSIYYVSDGLGLAIGRDGGANNSYFNGKIYQTLIYNRALSAAEVSQNFNALRSRFGI